MKLYRSLGRVWTGTQADAKAAQGNTDFETIEVPTDKPSLITFLNETDIRPGEKEAREREETAAGISGPTEEPATPPPEPDPATIRDAQKARFEALARKLGWTPPGEASATPAAPTIDKVEEMIGELTGNDLIRILSSAISRLGEIAGTRGWAAFAKNVYAWSPAAKSVEQGLGMLMLATFDHFGEKSGPMDNADA